MKVLVTGGAGYIGSVVTEKLISAGHQAVVYDDLSKGHRQAVVKDAEFVKGDVRNGTELRAVLVEQRIDAVIHLAADSLVGESMEQPAKYYSSNVFGGMVLLNALREAKVKRIVFSSTAAVYGEPEKQPIEETDPTAPTNAYGETKLTFERMLRWYELPMKFAMPPSVISMRRARPSAAASIIRRKRI
jgi:UDP-glucose 4-epimerase